MKKIILILLYLFVSQIQCFSQTILYGTKSYVEYRVGTLPIVISVPHGGNRIPTLIPDRTCYDPVTVTDANTIDIAENISAALFSTTGSYPHIIICNLDRSKLDCNRTLAEGACSDLQAEKAWTEYHNFITTAQNTTNLKYNNKTILVDLHGHGHAIQRIELGYLLSASQLNYTDATLNSTAYINQSSIKNLALNNINNYTHSQLLRGPKSFGTLLANEGFAAVPSQQDPYPLTTESYFSGGYTTQTHTCFDPTITHNGFQMELNYEGVRNTSSNRFLFADKFRNVVLDYLNTHTNVTLGNYIPFSLEGQDDSELIAYPNPIKSGSQLFLKGAKVDNSTYKIFNSIGQLIVNGKVTSSNEIEMKSTLNKGVYLLSVYSFDGYEIKKLKLMIN
ncbi:MAG: T9SS type A sorting domain-containing protein [Bacteroidetes bacterium]|nr:T9SS type A sorting domain-containing protein [Bacteroidota bacterium]